MLTRCTSRPLLVIRQAGLASSALNGSQPMQPASHPPPDGPPSANTLATIALSSDLRLEPRPVAHLPLVRAIIDQLQIVEAVVALHRATPLLLHVP